MFDPIIPIKYFPSLVDKIAEQLHEIHLQTRFRRFLLTYPGLDVRIEGFPQSEAVEAFASDLATMKSQLSSVGVQVGWWHTGTLKCGANPFAAEDPRHNEFRFHHITDLSGAVSPISACPLDDQFVKKFVRHIQIVSARSHPFLILLEDDFELSNHSPVRFGCFCPLHLDTFSERAGRRYEREELAEIFSTQTQESVHLRRLWSENSQESLVRLARKVRRGLDEVDDSVRIGLCQSGVADFDGDFTVPVAHALAGDETRPMVRAYGSSYSSDDAASIPNSTFHMLYTSQSAPENFEVDHESDTYPHTRFFMSATKLRALMTTAMLYGLDGSLLYLSQYLDEPFEETGYAQMAVRNAGWFEAVQEAAHGCTVIGVEAVYDPFDHVCRVYDAAAGRTPMRAVSPWVGVFGRLGIPCTARNGTPKAVAGDVFCEWSDERIRELLSGPVLLDGVAAHALCKRGFDELIGVRLRHGDRIRCLYEGVSDEEPWKRGLKGRLMYNFAVAPAGKEGSAFFELEALPGTSVVSSFLTPALQELSPACTVFVNPSGGRIAVTAYDLEKTQSSSVFNYRKKALMRNLMEWLMLAPLPVFAVDNPNVFVVALENTARDYGVSAVFNLAGDAMSHVTLALDERWMSRQRRALLNDEGRWTDFETDVYHDGGSSESRVIDIACNCATMEPVIIKHQA